MANQPIYKYPLDLAGSNPDNFVVGEKHEIGSVRARIFIADYGPFFAHLSTVRDGDTGRTLEPMTDFVYVHTYREAQEITGQAVYSGVRIVNPDVSTTIEFDVHYVGGEFSYSHYALLDMLRAIINDNRPIDWGELIGVPNEWAPTPHLHSAYDLYAMKHIVAATHDVADAVRDGNLASHQLLFDMIDARIEVFETVVPSLIDCYARGERLLATLL